MINVSMTLFIICYNSSTYFHSYGENYNVFKFMLKSKSPFFTCEFHVIKIIMFLCFFFTALLITIKQHFVIHFELS